MGRGGRGVTRASVSGLPTRQVSREPTQFSSLKGKERNPPGWIRVHTLDGAGGGWWQRVRTTNSLLFLLRTQAGPVRTKDPAPQGLSQAGR